MIESLLLELSPPPMLNTAMVSTLPCSLNHDMKEDVRYVIRKALSLSLIKLPHLNPKHIY